MKPTLLVVEDEEQIVRVLEPTLRANGYEPVVAPTGQAALAALKTRRIDAVILDLGLPDMDGKKVLRAGRDLSPAPFLVLSARGAESEKIAALDEGAEDYLSKPFSVGELMARLRVLLRSRRVPADADTITVGDLELDPRRRRVRLPTGEVQLSGREAEFLRLLAERHGGVVTHREIVLAIWGDLTRADAQFVRVLAGQVRQKVEEDAKRPRRIQTVPGIGYQLSR